MSGRQVRRPGIIYWIAWGIVASYQGRAATRSHRRSSNGFSTGATRRTTSPRGSSRRSGGSGSAAGGIFTSPVDRAPQGYQVTERDGIAPSSWVDRDAVYDAERDDTIDAEVLGENVDVTVEEYDGDGSDVTVGTVEDEDYGFQQDDDIVIDADDGDRVG